MDYGPALPLDRYSIPPNNMLPTRRQNSYHAGTAISQSTRATQSIQQPAHLSIPIDNAPYEHHAWNTPSTQLAFYHGAGATPAHSSDHTRYPAGQSYLPAYTSAAAQDQFLSLYAQSNPGSFYNEPTPVAQQENSHTYHVPYNTPITPHPQYQSTSLDQHATMPASPAFSWSQVHTPSQQPQSALAHATWAQQHLYQDTNQASGVSYQSYQQLQNDAFIPNTINDGVYASHPTTTRTPVPMDVYHGDTEDLDAEGVSADESTVLFRREQQVPKTVTMTPRTIHPAVISRPSNPLRAIASIPVDVVYNHPPSMHDDPLSPLTPSSASPLTPKLADTISPHAIWINPAARSSAHVTSPRLESSQQPRKTETIAPSILINTGKQKERADDKPSSPTTTTKSSAKAKQSKLVKRKTTATPRGKQVALASSPSTSQPLPRRRSITRRANSDAASPPASPPPARPAAVPVTAAAPEPLDQEAVNGVAVDDEDDDDDVFIPDEEAVTPVKPLHIACTFCRRRKIACIAGPSGDRDVGPCMPCAKRNFECHRPPISKRGHRRRGGRTKADANVASTEAASSIKKEKNDGDNLSEDEDAEGDMDTEIPVEQDPGGRAHRQEG